jgi:hypothetical protein
MYPVEREHDISELYAFIGTPRLDCASGACCQDLEGTVESTPVTQPVDPDEGYVICMLRRDVNTGRYTFVDAPAKKEGEENGRL